MTIINKRKHELKLKLSSLLRDFFVELDIYNELIKHQEKPKKHDLMLIKDVNSLYDQMFDLMTDERWDK